VSANVSASTRDISDHGWPNGTGWRPELLARILVTRDILIDAPRSGAVARRPNSPGPLVAFLLVVP